MRDKAVWLQMFVCVMFAQGVLGATVDVDLSVKPADVSATYAQMVCGEAPLTVHFDGSDSMSPTGGVITDYDWGFGDGAVDTGVAVSHTYSEGAYEAALTVVDDVGESHKVVMDIRVFPVPILHTITASVTSMNGSMTPSGAIAVYEGEDQAFTMVPDVGYRVAEVRVDGENVDAMRSYIFADVMTDHTIEVTFEEGLPLPLAYWPLDELSGETAEDATGNGYDGMLVNGPVWTSGQVGGALMFDGTDDYVNVPSGTVLEPEQITVALWTKVTGDGSHQDIYGNYMLSKGRASGGGYFSYGLSYLPASDQVAAVVSVDGGFRTVKSTTTVAPGSDWVHVALTYDGQAITLYVNGVDEGQGAYPGSIYYALANRDLHLGDWGFGSYKRAFEGVLDDVRIYDRALVAQEIATLAAGAAPPVTHTITASAGANGQIAPDGAVDVIEGQNQTFTISEDLGYQIADVLVDSVSVGAVASYTFNDVTADHTIAASFEVAPVVTHTITASAGANGQIEPDGDVQVVEGQDQTFTIAPAGGYRVADVLVNGGSVGAVPSYTFDNVTANHTIAASFEEDVVPTDDTIPSTVVYGYGVAGCVERIDKVVYALAGQAGDATLTFDLYDMDYLTEVEISVNGTVVGAGVYATANNAWQDGLSIVVPDALMVEAGQNIVTFDNTYNPPNTYIWAVRNVSASFASEPDNDNDGMPDEWELTYGLDPFVDDADLDTDGDGMLNWEEYIAGTDPTSPGSRFKVGGMAVLGDGVTLSFDSVTGRVYDVESCDDLTVLTWLNVDTNLSGTGGALDVGDAGFGGRRFYRIRVRME